MKGTIKKYPLVDSLSAGKLWLKYKIKKDVVSLDIDKYLRSALDVVTRSSWISRNIEAFASEFLKNLEEMFQRLLII